MARWGWLIFGTVFSMVIFLALYLLVYLKLTSGAGTEVVMNIGKWDVSSWRNFLSNIWNIILASLVLGFLLGGISQIGVRRGNR